MSVSYPVVNGIRFDFSSMELKVAGKAFPGLKSLNYKHSLSPGIVKGTAAQDLGRTRGQYSAEGDMEIYREDSDDFFTLVQAQQPSLGILEVSFDMNVTFAELAAGAVPQVQNDRLIGCRLKEDGASNSQGSDPSTIKLSFHIMMLIKNGRFPIGIPQVLGTRL